MFNFIFDFKFKAVSLSNPVKAKEFNETEAVESKVKVEIDERNQANIVSN